MDNLHHLCIGFDNWTQVGFDSEDPKFSFGARQLEKGACHIHSQISKRSSGQPSPPVVLRQRTRWAQGGFDQGLV